MKKQSKIPKDLHAEKASHLTVAIHKGIELHLEKKDFVNLKHPKVGKKVHMKIPMVTTSVDPGHARFRQVGRLTPEEVQDKKIKIVLKKNNIVSKGDK